MEFQPAKDLAPMTMPRAVHTLLTVSALTTWALLPGCGNSGNSSSAAVEGNEDAVRQHIEQVNNEEMAHFKGTVQATKSAR